MPVFRCSGAVALSGTAEFLWRRKALRLSPDLETQAKSR